MPLSNKPQGLQSVQKTALLVLSALGMLIMAYLTYIHYSNARSFCDLSEKISCDVVTTSIYSEIFGFPVSIFGFLYFAFVFSLVLLRKKEEVYQIVFFLTLLILVPSLYLTFTEVLFIGSFCILCETSKALMVLILALSFRGMKKSFSEVARISVPVLIAGLVLSGVTFFAQTGNATKKDYSKFVESLNNAGIVYYKSFKCSNCKRQEMLFGPAYKKLNSVECHPDGPNAKAELCLAKKISKTPTFLIEKDGKEVKRLEGLQQLETIAKWAEVPFEGK